ncbi:MAG: DMT family transporter [Pseudoxanthomonas suwonensis]|nr:DMT family transporter [Pseudoxanthomonas suwonensis]
MHSPHGLHGRDLLLVMVIVLAWAGNFLTSAWALQEIPPFLFTAVRMGFLVLLLLPFLRLPPAGQWRRLAAVALLNGALHFGTSFWALHAAGNIASPAIVMQSYVPMATVLAWWFLGERFGWRTGLAVVVSFAGVMVLGFDPMVLAEPAALLVMLLSALLLAMGTVVMRGLKGVDMITQQGWTAVLALPALLGLSLALEPGGFDRLADASWVGWGGAAYSAVAASLLGHGLFYVLVQRHPVAQVTPWLLLTPVLAIGLGIAFYGDRPGLRLWIGGAMVLGGVLLIALRTLAKARSTVSTKPGV